MEAIYFAKSHKHYFRKVEVKKDKADLYDSNGVLIYKDVPISDTPKEGHCVISGADTAKPAK